MGRCCGGKNAGKPISITRYLAGLFVFGTYHGSVSLVLHTLALPFPRLRKVRDFHRELMMRDLREVLAREDININGPEPVDEEACPIPEGAPMHPQTQRVA